ncbi:hypothetical protein [Amycolatopsis sp. NPDC051903]|uniref:hypothetical protein n=1 Tax=Amycolatopsis sp. NPDC051903 TaxID=3363936 RepID=UPI0037A51373
MNRTKGAVAAPRVTAMTGLVLAAGVVVQGLFAGGFLGGDHGWFAWHEVLGTALVLPPLVSLVAALVLLRRQPDPPSVLATRVFLLVLVVVVIVTGHAGRGLLAVHIPAAVAVAGIAVRQAAGFVRIPALKRNGSGRAEGWHA